MKLFVSVFLFLLMLSGFVQAQIVPNYATEEEKASLKDYVKPVPKGIQAPPVSPVRNPAEWEEMDAVLISWRSGYESFLSEIIEYAREEAMVYIYCTDSSTVKSYFSNAGISTQNTRYIQTSLNSVWIRDFGPNNIYTNDVDSLLLMDWVYNRNRPLDDASPALFASRVGLPLYEATQPPVDLVATGGNFMSDGLGTAFSSELILDENATVSSFNQTPKTEQDIKDILSDYLGINQYVLFETLPYDGIHHIDMHMKILDEETILVGEYPTGISDGPQIETNIQYLQDNFVSVFGTPYKIVRIPMPPSSSGSWPSQGAYYRTYTNSLILNKTVLVPTYYQQYDTTALRIYREAMPGYRVIGIDANSIISQSGTIHCTSHEIATSNPLLIVHQEHENTNNVWTDYEINAVIQHRSGIASAFVYYTTDTNVAFTSVPMTLLNATTNTWQGLIPVQPSGTTVYYYIEANSVSGKNQVRPLPAPDAFWQFYVYNPTSATELTDGDFQMNAMSLSDNMARLVIKSTYSLNVDIDIHDITGRKLKAIYSGEWNSGTQSIDFSTSGLSSGIYIVKVETEMGCRSQRLFIQ